MTAKNSDKKPGKSPDSKGKPKASQEGYPLYPEDEDIYSRNRELGGDPERPEAPDDFVPYPPDAPNEVDDQDSRMGDDLDVPGADLDDPEESIGEEDEENNYYSLEDQDDDIPPEE